MKEEDFDLSVSEFDSGVYLSTSMDLVEATQLVKEILHNKQFADRCAKDGLLTYDRKCNEIKQLVKSMDLQYIIDDIFCMNDQVASSHRLEQGRKLEALKKLVDKK